MKNIFLASISLLALLIVGACNKSSQLGADLFSGNNLNLSFSDSLITVTAETENPDSVLAINYVPGGTSKTVTILPLGKMYDPIFGVAEARIYTNLTYSSTARPNVDTLATYVLDSAKFVMAYSGADAYGDTTQKQTINLYRLDASEALIGDNSFTYFSNKRLKTLATPIGGISDFVPTPNTRVAINDTVSYRPHIAFKIDPVFAQTLLDTGINSVYNQSYLGSISKYFRGFEIRSEKTTGAMLSFNIADDSSGLFLYYHTKGLTDTLTYKFVMTATSFPSFNQDYAKGSINKFYNGKKTISGDSLLFLQGMAGPNVRFEFPNLKKQLGTAAVNRAELEFTIVEDSTDKYPPIERLLLVTASGSLVADLQRNTSTALADFGGVVVTEAGNLRRYRCNISQHLQNMLYGTAGTILYLMPDNTRGSAPNKQGTTRRVVLYGTKSSKYRTKLNLYYTKP